MKAIIYRCYGSPDVLEFAEITKPVPADNEVLIKVKSASANPLEHHFMRGTPYLLRLMAGLGAPEDYRLGRDFAGIVEAVGKDVSKFKVGDEVFGGTSGAYAEYATVRDDRGIALKPENVTFQQAGVVNIAGITALQGLRDIGNIQAGEKVLINGASGGVGTFAVQIAKAYGAEVTGVSSARNHAMVRSIGADHMIDYKTENYTESDKKYDLIVDMVGNHGLLDNRKVLTEQGRMVIIGGAKGNWIAPFKGPMKAMFVRPFIDQEIQSFTAQIKGEDLTYLAELMAKGQVVPVIDKTFQLNKTADAIRYLEKGRTRGNIVIEIN